MPWLELCVIVDSRHQATVESTLEELGALAVTLADADADTPDEQAIFEPGVGELPLWPRTRVQALFAADLERAPLLRALIDARPDIKPADVTFHEVADRDWERAWMDRFQPMRFGRRLWIYPWNIEPPADVGLAVVRLDPGLAFGSGTHPTTALCLEWLEGLELAGMTVIDYGCGSGVLAVAALKLGAARAIGVDNDPQALTATRANAERNGVAARLDVCAPDTLGDTAADACVANILARPLMALAARIAALCKPGAPLALSGILDGQQTEVQACYAPWCGPLAVHQRDGWVRLDGRRTSRAAGTKNRATRAP